MFTLLEDAAQTRSEEELCDLISEYVYQTQLHGGLLAKRFKIRVSGQRLLNLHAEARKTSRRPAPNPE